MHKFFIYCLTVVMAVSMMGCGNSLEESLEEAKQEALEEESEQGEEEPEDVVSEGVYSKITGLPMEAGEENERPMAVMISNIKDACPQSGISEASIIYEAPVEGRITRLMGIFENYDELEKVGSVRSSRDYFVYLALEFDAMYAHFGQATVYVGDLLNGERVDNISGAVAGITQPSVNAFERSTDAKAPHNVFVTGKGLAKDIAKNGYPIIYDQTYETKFVYPEYGERVTYDDAQDATTLYPGGKTTDLANGFSRVGAQFVYNEETQTYDRFEYGEEQIDKLTGEQLSFTNVVFQYCHGEIRDENDYLAFGLHGDEGFKVQIFTNGKMVEGTWNRTGQYDTSPALYYDENGEQIMINRGNTWVCIIWDEYGEDVVIE